MSGATSRKNGGALAVSETADNHLTRKDRGGGKPVEGVRLVKCGVELVECVDDDQDFAFEAGLFKERGKGVNQLFVVLRNDFIKVERITQLAA